MNFQVRPRELSDLAGGGESEVAAGRMRMIRACFSRSMRAINISMRMSGIGGGVLFSTV